ncbi:MAG TPA: bifunctional riboflavin kinase/FAD synthetase [Chloroflexi bacterium]|nr:bifunctional riboflavin kinase/FAD synthetase [Chloroflexota bacterium]
MSDEFIRVNDLAELREEQPTYVAVGSFDGVHLGHQAVLNSMVAAAQKAGAQTAVLTFFPHPRRVIQNLTDPYYIATLDDRVKWIAELGVNIVITQPFNETVRNTRAADFVQQLRDHLNMRQLWGGDFALGYKREGDVPTLRRLGAEKGYKVELVDGLVKWDGELVSSSRIRRCLRAGDMENVRGCMGRPYRVHGAVVEGDKRGRTIGFPTANLAYWEEQLLPANGVYAAWAWVGDKKYMAATNIGVRPTFDHGPRTVEAYLLDFEGDLYGRELCLEFIRRLRPEQKFAGLDELVAQIQTDIDLTRRILQSGSR